MKKLPRVISLALIGTLSFAAVGTAFAWTTVGSSDYDTTCGSSNLDLIAQDSDVVTTAKWNSMICTMWIVYSAVADWPRTYTSFFHVVSNTIDSKKGNVVLGIGLGYTTAAGFPYIAFYNGDYQFGGAGRPPLGSFNFMPKDKGADNSLQINGFEGGIRIVPGADSTQAPTGTYLLGWEGVSLSDTTPFDVNCDYRFSTNIGAARGYHASSVDSAAIRLTEDGGWGDNVYNPMYLEVHADSKAVVHHFMQTGISPPSHGAGVVTMEKLCLPSYNPQPL